MAAVKRKNTSGNAAKRKTTASKRPTKAEQEASLKFKKEIGLICVLAVSVLLLLSCFGIGGFVGSFAARILFGVFGIAAYIFPVILFVGTAFFLSNSRSLLAKKKAVAAIFLFIAVCILMHLLTGPTSGTANFTRYYSLSATYKSGGGIIGGVIGSLLVSAVGFIGAYVVTIVIILCSLIIVTQRSLFGFFAGVVRQGKDRHKSAALRREKERPARELAAQRKQEKARERKLQHLELKAQTKQEPEQQSHPLPEPETEVPAAVLEEPVFTLPLQITGMQAADETMTETPLPEEPSVDSTAEEAEALPARRKKSSQKELTEGMKEITSEMRSHAAGETSTYQFPPISLLKKPARTNTVNTDKLLYDTAQKLQETLSSFGVGVTVTNVSCGPSVTRYELTPEHGVKVSRIVALADDIKLNLAASDIRIEAPIPGKAAVGIEVPNKENTAVSLRELIQSPEFAEHPSRLVFAAGKDIAGKTVIADIAKMPHLLIAGATGSGKSVCINTLIVSILYKSSPEDVKMIMIDPKVVELSVYNGIPHLYIPVVTDPKKAAGALNWAVAEMTQRYNTFAEFNVRNLEEYNARVKSLAEQAAETTDESSEQTTSEVLPQKLPQIVIIVDELADLMMVAPGEVEDAICRLAQLARAAGIHLIIATQRPSVNVITGLIKANMPSRIAFAVSSGVDSRTILDMNGAEKLLGKGDMLFYPQGYAKPARLQGAFIANQEVTSIVKFLAQKHPNVEYNDEIEQKVNTANFSASIDTNGRDELDPYFIESGKFIIEKDKASIGMLQRMFKIGFNRAARIMDQLAQANVVGPEEGTKPRKILMTAEEFEEYINQSL
ncbi:MAG: DNA translocase FtsK 4TM domain-containing protein [Lachnospiraceae bacterium]